MRNSGRLTGEPFDLLVVGGGIHGACVARDAALRGMSVALVDRGDFGAATSHNSLKIVHGGIRYLQHLDFARVCASVRERNIWLRTAPHLVKPLEFVLPTFGWGMRGRPALAAAFAMYNVLARDRNRGLSASQQLPSARTVGRGECLARLEGIDPGGVTGAAIWSDGQITDADRVLIECLQDAAAAGAVPVNYCEVQSLIRDGQTVRGAHAVDRTTGDRIEIRAAMTINAAGPWAGDLLRAGSAPVGSSWATERAWALNVVLPDVGLRTGIGIPGAERRVYFATPWCGSTVVGTWQGEGTGDGEVGEEQIESFLGEVRARFPRLPARREDVTYYHAGLMPVERRMEDGSLRFARHSALCDHESEDGIRGVLSIQSVKWTTARLVAERAVDRAAERMGRECAPCATATRPLPGMLSNRPIDESLATRAERACREDWVVRLDDLVERRLHAGFGGWPSVDDLDLCTEVAARELGWDGARTRAERERVDGKIARHRGRTAATAGE